MAWRSERASLTDPRRFGIRGRREPMVPAAHPPRTTTLGSFSGWQVASRRHIPCAAAPFSMTTRRTGRSGRMRRIMHAGVEFGRHWLSVDVPGVGIPGIVAPSRYLAQKTEESLRRIVVLDAERFNPPPSRNASWVRGRGRMFIIRASIPTMQWRDGIRWRRYRRRPSRTDRTTTSRTLASGWSLAFLCRQSEEEPQRLVAGLGGRPRTGRGDLGQVGLGVLAVIAVAPDQARARPSSAGTEPGTRRRTGQRCAALGWRPVD